MLVDTNSNSQDSLLDTVFDNFYAMPYGHVESDVYSIIKENLIEGVSINNKNTTLSTSTNYILDKTISKKIQDSINKLKHLNPHLIELTSFDLVELSHSWYSWQYYYSLAQKQGLNSLEIENSVIKDEDKIFSL
nr:Panacea domain-containing protein [Tenacibaculum aquimarinum]